MVSQKEEYISCLKSSTINGLFKTQNSFSQYMLLATPSQSLSIQNCDQGAQGADISVLMGQS